MVQRHSVIMEVSANQRLNVASLLVDRLMHPSPKFQIDLLQLLQHPLPHRLPNHRELSPLVGPAAVRESEKVERFRFPLTTTISVLRRKSAELDQSRLLRVQLQSELAETFTQVAQ